MKKSLLAILMTMALVVVGSMALAGGGALPAADGQAVYEFITKTDNYQNWPLWPGKDKFYEGKHPHGALLTTYVSTPAEAAIQDRAGAFPVGSMIVKENYSPGKELGAVTVMYRVKGYDPNAGDWFWAKYKADGSIEKEGKVSGCIGCHSAVIQNDWVFTGPLE